LQAHQDSKVERLKDWNSFCGENATPRSRRNPQGEACDKKVVACEADLAVAE
jgi:hypothetical protein